MNYYLERFLITLAIVLTFILLFTTPAKERKVDNDKKDTSAIVNPDITGTHTIQ